MATGSKTNRFLRLILFLSNSYPKTKEECTSFLGIRDSAFYTYCNQLKNSGFNLHQKEGKYWIDYPEQDFQVLRNILHFSEEETYLLSQAIDLLNENTECAARLKNKLVTVLNQEKVVEDYLLKEKSTKVQMLHKASQQKKQILLVNYSSGNSDTVKNRLVEPFEFKDDFNLVWAFDTALKQNRQFKICRIQDLVESPVNWEYEHQHRSKPVDIFRNTGDLNKNIELHLNLKASNLLIEEYPLAKRFLNRIKDNRYELNVPVAKYEGPARFVLGLAENIDIKGDDGFKKFFVLKLKKICSLRKTWS
jgi:predicted DNA-binding transcriptional regulator YafY